VRTRWIRVVVSFAAVLAGAGACNALTGAGDFDVRAEEDGGEPAEASSAKPVDAGTREDAPGPTVVPSCECVAASPPGWIGPVALFLYQAREPAPCPGGLLTAMSGGNDPQAPEPGCEPCTCTLDASCNTVTVQTHKGYGCSSTCSVGAATVGATCTALTFCYSASSVTITSVGQGSCTASGGARRPAGWREVVTACMFADGTDGGVTAPSDAGCDLGLACAPKIEGLSAPTCIVHEGDATCPEGPYSIRFTFGGSISDTRSCTPCTCGDAQVTCAGGEVTFYRNNACTNLLNTSSIPPPSCKNMAVADFLGGAKITKPALLVDGGCPSSGGVVDGGTVTAASPWTACCLP
jgi:hypothetical protein